MKIKDLIEKLSKYDENLEVILMSDREGNNASPLDEIDDFYYWPQTTWNGEIIDPVDIGGYDVIELGIKKVVTFWPVN
jgi:hypothetical protein